MKIQNVLALFSVMVGSSQTLVMAQTTEAQTLAAQDQRTNQLLQVKTKLESGIRTALLAPEMEGAKLVTFNQKNGAVEPTTFETILSTTEMKEYAVVTPVIAEVGQAFGVKTSLKKIEGADQISFSIRVKSADFKADYAGRVINIDIKDINQTQVLMEDNVRSLSAQVLKKFPKKIGFLKNQKTSKTFAQKLLGSIVPSAEAEPIYDSRSTKVMKLGMMTISAIVLAAVVTGIIYTKSAWLEDIRYVFREGGSIGPKKEMLGFFGVTAAVMALCGYGIYSGLKSILEF